MDSPRFSLIIPAYNEARFLPRLLDSLDIARAAYGDPGAIEVIVADNLSTDATAEIPAARGCRVVRAEKRVIAAVRNAGARSARGEILAFVDADSQVHRDTFARIDRALATERVVAGATGVRLERLSFGLAVTYLALIPIVFLSGLDTGVVFCRKEDFEALGGYDEDRLFAEDAAFLLALRRLGKARGQRLARLRGAKAIMSTRKFDEFGDWHYFRLIGDVLRHLRRGGATEFTDKYWYKPKR